MANEKAKELQKKHELEASTAAAKISELHQKAKLANENAKEFQKKCELDASTAAANIY